MFIPCPDNLLVNLRGNLDLVAELLHQLPQRFEGTHETHSALGAALQAAFKMLVSSHLGKCKTFTCGIFWGNLDLFV